MPQPAASEQPAAAAAASPSPPMQHHTFTDTCLDVPVHFQILNLSRQLYIWVGTGSAAQAADFTNLALALPQPAASPAAPPAATSLVRGPGDDQATGIAQKLVRKVRMPVALSWSLPAGDAMQTAWAQRKLGEYLQQLGFIAMNGPA